MVRHVLLVTLALVVAGCGEGGDDDAATTTASPTTSAPTTAAPTTAAPTTAAPTTAAPTTAAPTTAAPTTATPPTTAGCPSGGSTAMQGTNDPLVLSGLVGKEIRYARFDACTERVVVELQGTGEMPSWWVQYEDEPSGPSGIPPEMAGDAVLVVHAGAWMTSMEGEGYQGPTEIPLSGFTALRELELIENFEGMFQWGIGLDRERPFTAFALDDPPRIVVDIAAPAA